MDALFIKVLNMSITASWLILVILLVRLLFQKIPARFFCLLWAMCGLRLILPWQWESRLSLVPSGQVVTPEILLSQKPAVESGVAAVNEAVNPLIDQSFAPQAGDSVNPLQICSLAAAAVWLAGILILAAAAGISYFRLRRQVAEAVPLGDGVWHCDGIRTPFILGIIRPKIYVPFSDLSAESGVMAHEKAHLKRFDHIAKPLAYGILILHWFNPLVWAAFRSFCHDIERACDESVISHMALPARKQYSSSLLSFASENGKKGFCPLAFGEISVKERVERVLRFKKPTRVVICAGVILICLVCVFFMTGPVQCPKELEEAVSKALLSETSDYAEHEALAEGHIIWRVEKDGEETRVYANTSVGQYGFLNDRFVEQSGSGATPAILYFTGGEAYTFSRIEYPKDGERYTASIKEMFPWLLQWKASNAQDAYGRLEKQKEAYAKAYLEKIEREAKIGSYGDFHFKLWSEGFPTEIINELTEKYPEYGFYEGTSEHFHQGQRCVRQVESDHESTIVFSHYLYDGGTLFERITVHVDGDTYTESVACGREIEE